MIKFYFLLSFLFLTHSLNAASQPFVAVFVDAKTEKSLGPFPYDRSKTAQAINKLYKYGAKAIVIKYFFDQPRKGGGDDELVRAIKKIPVLLQAQFDDQEKAPNIFSERFNISKNVEGDISHLLSGASGWIPLEKLSKQCAGIGFVDVLNPSKPLVPLVVKYQSMIVPSLWLATIELLEETKAKIVIGKAATIGKRVIPLKDTGEAEYKIPKKDSIDSVSFIDLLEGQISKEVFYGKIVILGVDLKAMPTFKTHIGQVGSHRLFYHSLLGLL